MYKIYKYTNLVNNKIYIGQTSKTLEERAKNGSNYKGSRYFYHAIQKYGWDNFIPEILEDNLDRDEANIKEEYYISLYNSCDPNVGYNIAYGGNNHEMPDTTKQLLSAKAIERYKDVTKNPMYGKTHSDKALKKMSEKKTGKNNPMYGVKMTKESNEKRRETCKNRNCDFTHEWTDEERQRASQRFKQLATTWSKKVHCIEDNTYFDSILQASEHYGVTKSTLSGHLHGYQKTCAKKHFEFVID